MVILEKQAQEYERDAKLKEILYKLKEIGFLSKVEFNGDDLTIEVSESSLKKYGLSISDLINRERIL